MNNELGEILWNQNKYCYWFQADILISLEVTLSNNIIGVSFYLYWYKYY